jgi:HEAT repeat protein
MPYWKDPMKSTLCRIGMAGFLFFSLSKALAQVGKPVDDPNARLSNAQLVGALKDLSAKGVDYVFYRPICDEILLRGPNPEIISLLVPMLQDPNQGVANNVAAVLTQFRCRQVTPFLVSILGNAQVDSTPPDSPLLNQFESLGDPAAKAALTEFFRSGRGSQGMGRTMVVLARLGSRDLIPEFKQYLNDRLSYMQSYAIEALTILGDRNGHEKIRNFLKGNTHYVDGQCVETLALFGDTGDLPLLDEMQKRFTYPKHSDDPIDLAHWQIKDQHMTDTEKVKAFGALLEPVQASYRLSTALWVLGQLGAIGSPGAIELLKKTATGTGPYAVRLEAFEQLMRRGILLAHQKTDKFGYIFFLANQPAGVETPAAITH